MIHVVSFGLGFCLFHADYSKEKGVVLSNKGLLDAIKNQKKTEDKLIVMLGSMRQSVAVDSKRSQQTDTESGFTAIQQISDYLGATLDPFLLADVYGSLESGESFKRAVETYTGNHADWVKDSTRISIVFGQFQKIANDYPGETIRFDFYDDRGFRAVYTNDVLEYMRSYFTFRYPEMMPSQVTLHLNYYDGKKLKSYAPIQGKGVVDENYRETILAMNELAKTCGDIDSIFPNSVYHVDLRQIPHLAERIPAPPQKAKKHKNAQPKKSGILDCPASAFQFIFSFFKAQPQKDEANQAEAELKMD
ncbi:MAG: hypothetical protein WC785_07000 [Tatlockia sp.]|jgi:hypothetical protein